MKNLAIITFCCLTFSVIAQNNITGAEYFIGEDPGFGNALTLDITPGQTVDESFQIPVNGLSEGVHFLHIRVQDANGTWSHFAKKMFAIITPIPQTQLIAAEYFIGEDPGFGNGHPLTVQAGDAISATFDIPVEELEADKLHFLHIRVKNSLNKWSHFTKKMFYVMDAVEENSIIAAEYFIDQDPGIGQGSMLSIDPASTINEEFAITIPDTLMDGFHFLYIRVQDNDGTWSHYANHQFMIGEGTGITTLTANLEIYPNPTTGILHLQSEKATIQRVVLINIHGQILLETIPDDNHVDITGMPNGVYLLQIYTSNGSVSRRIVKQ